MKNIKKKKGENMRKIRKYIWMVAIIFCSVFCVKTSSVYAETPKGQIIMSVEKSVLGQGYLMEPQYVDFYEGDNLATVTLRQLQKIGRRYNYTGGTDHGFYLAEISDRGRGTVNIPDYIKKLISKSNMKIYADSTPEYLGEFDYTNQSGWMFCYNGSYPIVSACKIKPKNGDVLQWQFTLVGLGTDLKGNTDYFNQNGKTVLDRVEVSRILAKIKKRPELLNDGETKRAYDRCIKLAMDLDTAQSDLYGDMTVLKKALQENTVSDIRFFENISQECYVKNGTAEKEISFPGYLKAVKSDGTPINIRVTWECETKYQAETAGDYTFVPVLPDAYIKGTGVTLPVYTVHVRKLGDVNGDGQVDSQDLEALVKELGNTYEYDEDGSVYDLNSDGIVNMQDYSLLIGAAVQSEIKSAGDAGLTLRFEKDNYSAGETGTAQLVFYSGKMDTLGIQLNYDPAKIKNVTIKGCKEFTVEKQEENENGSFFMLGRRSGALESNGFQGESIGEISFTCVKAGKPDLHFGKSTSKLLKDQMALGYRNGYEVTLAADENYGTEIKLLCQLNNGHVRTANFTDNEITENGQKLQVVNVVFYASDAMDARENRIRIYSQLPEGSTLEMGEELRNGQITAPLTEKNGIFYAEGKAGCFTGGGAPQKENSVLYGVLTEKTEKKYFKILITRMGHAAVTYTYTEQEPLILNGWSSSEPEVLTGNWNLESVKLQGWDKEGNPVSDLKIALPSDTSGDFYYKGNEKQGKLYAKKAGDYWVDITNSADEVVGRLRITAVYPYKAAQYYINKAKEIPLDYSKYNSSAAEQVFEYKDSIDKAEKIQESYPSNQAVYLDSLGRYTTQDTGTRMTDSYGYEIFCDSLRTEVVNDLRDTAAKLRPVLDKNRIQQTVRKAVTFSGTKTVSRAYKKSSFLLGVKSNSNGKMSYSSSDQKVVTVTSGGKVTIKGIGKAVITVKTAQTTKFKSGERKIPVVITPEKAALTGLKCTKTKTATVKWKKISGITGYQIQYSRYGNFKKYAIKTVSSRSNSIVLRGIVKKKKYYVRVRGYKKIGKTTLYGSWSTAKTVNIK